MAKAEFLQNLRTARNLFFHRVQTDHSELDPRSIESQLSAGTIWLTPSSVKGFDPRDFRELSPERRDELKRLVDRFSRVARQVPPSKSPTREQVQEAAEPLLQVMEILRPYLISPGEPEKIRDVLKRIPYPPFVLTWDYVIDLDSTGDPGVWIYIFVDDDAPKAADFHTETNEIPRRIRTAFADAGIDYWPYVRIRTASEQRAL
jgi:hypothetical protein